jgi:hypothetical protein
MADRARQLFEVVKEQLIRIFPAFATLSWDQVGPTILQYMQEHPGLTALQLASFLIMLFPGMVAAPALGAAGFGSLGPTAGKLYTFSLQNT